jgi:threonylcarbamoyladenosine tRNA methylthiotransferase MtaB
MPLQSGNDKQLKLMRRRYKRELYFDRVGHIRKSMPHACIGADVIVGFPGELEEDFNETKRFLAELDVNYLHVFTYSERANTPATSLPGSISMEIRRDRNEQLRRLSLRKQRQFYQRFLGASRDVLLEKSKRSGYFNGFTDNYIKIQIPVEKGLSINEIYKLQLRDINEEGIVEARVRSEIQV